MKHFLISVLIGFLMGTILDCSSNVLKAQETGPGPSIYDSRTDKKKVIVEYCENNECYRLLLDKKDLVLKQDVIFKWFQKVLNEIDNKK